MSSCTRIPTYLTAGIFVLLLSAFAHAQNARVADPAVVQTSYGAVRGMIHDDVREFKGIPYAAAPVGALRWAMPRRPRLWTGVLDATKFGSACPQVSRYGLTEASDDENCLTINVTAPYDKPAKRKPVLVWIHGGAFVGGSSALYPLDTLVKSGDMVVVSMNYRLGVFGFMPHPSFDKAHNGGYGLEDQRLALRWVKRNIAAFGGDPNNVTIAGESAGGAGVAVGDGCAIISTMSKLLEDAIKKVRELPESDQDEAAEMLFSVASRRAEPIRLDEETRAAVREGQEQARRGEFASDEEMAAFFRRHGVKPHGA